jgi:hypothetical protein
VTEWEASVYGIAATVDTVEMIQQAASALVEGDIYGTSAWKHVPADVRKESLRMGHGCHRQPATNSDWYDKDDLCS